MGLREKEWAVKKIIEHEGFRLEPYTDTRGFITGGIGHKFTKEDFKNFNTKWPREKKEQYWADRFDEDLAKAERNAIALSNKYDIPLSDKNLYVLTDMSFNLGNEGVSKFKNFLTNLGKGKVEDAILEMKQVSKDDPTPSKWYKQVPNRVDSLVEILRSSNESSQ
jgi:GH24 family phage-related lysozyme (muramidase)